MQNKNGWLPDGEKKSEDTITRFDRIPEHDRETDGRTDRQRMTAEVARIASSGKNCDFRPIAYV